MDDASGGHLRTATLRRVPRRSPPPPLTGPRTRAGALADGVTDWGLRHAGVRRLSRDTYLPTADAGELPVLVKTVLLTAPDGAVVSHRTAAALWDLEIPLVAADARVDLLVPTSSRARNRTDRRLHRTRLANADRDRRWGIPLTSPARTWRDLAGVLPIAALLAVTDQLLAAWCSPAELAAQLAARPNGRGAARARAVLPIADRRAESPMESVLRWLLHAAGLPPPEVQLKIHDTAGRFLGRADLAWPDRRLLIEFDGDHHRRRDVFVVDTRRQNRLVADGWTVLRFTSADIRERPDAIVAEIAAALA